MTTKTSSRREPGPRRGPEGEAPAPAGEAAQGAARIGARLRDRRKLRQLSLQEVAGRAGVSAALLSQVERGISAPSLETMVALCAALDMPASWLFDNSGPAGAAPEEACIVRRGARRVLDLSARGMIKEMLTPDACRRVQMMRMLIRPGGSSGEAPYNHPEGAKCGTVLAGTLSLEIGGRLHLLHGGDSFAFEATEMIRFWNEGPEEADVIWVGSPAFY
ncbi:helix-turn-helix domain-containing protein [Oceanicella sp. SM1341]|uniref:helix-turn-helix domain-containing protein n=1 Tax=Oceanicella sp. SM1341 TaxID=1548889 RepID=UPI001E517B16|nr:XRE family transcriptional regulator [Oceanicella sp. SM1341]